MRNRKNRSLAMLLIFSMLLGLTACAGTQPAGENAAEETVGETAAAVEE